MRLGSAYMPIDGNFRAKGLPHSELIVTLKRVCLRPHIHGRELASRVALSR